MEKKYIIIILTITFLALFGGLTYALFINEYSETVNFDGTTLTITHTFFDKMDIYNDSNRVHCIENNGKYLIKYWSKDDRLANGQRMDTIGSTKEKLNLVGQTRDTGPNPVKTTYNGETVYVCFTSNIAHGNIMIIAKDPDTAKRIYNSIKTPFNQWDNDNMTDNSTVTVNANTKKNTTNQTNKNPGSNVKPTPSPTPGPSPEPTPTPTPTPTNKTAKMVKT